MPHYLRAPLMSAPHSLCASLLCAPTYYLRPTTLCAPLLTAPHNFERPTTYYLPAQEEWRPHYIHYPALKKLIFEIARLEQEQAQAGGHEGPVVLTDEEHLLGGYANYEAAISQKEVGNGECYLQQLRMHPHANKNEVHT